MRFTHNDTTYIITDCLNNGQCDRGYRITERGTIIEDTAAVVRAYHAYFLDRYGLENLATDEMIRLERQWDAEVAELKADDMYADACDVMDSMEWGLWATGRR